MLLLCVVVCNAGFHLNGNDCVGCPGNTIKSLPGNERDCNTDTACDGESTIANDNHRACGGCKIFWLYELNVI